MLATNFLNAYHVSNLEVYSKGLFGKANWDKRLCVLSNIGLLIFSKAEDKNPRLFPTIDAHLQAVGPKIFQKDNVFRMMIFNGEELILAAFSKDDYDTWVRAIKKLKEETERRKKVID